MWSHKCVEEFEVTLKTTSEESVVKIQVMDDSNVDRAVQTKTVLKFDSPGEAEEVYRKMQSRSDIESRLVAELI